MQIVLDNLPDINTCKVEIWNSNQSQEERHYFLSDEGNTYLFGYNPQLVEMTVKRKDHDK